MRDRRPVHECLKQLTLSHFKKHGEWPERITVAPFVYDMMSAEPGSMSVYGVVVERDERLIGAEVGDA